MNYGAGTKRGTITLCDKDGPLRSVKYDGPKNRKEILEAWKRQYGKGFQKLCFQISPELREEDLREVKLQAA